MARVEASHSGRRRGRTQQMRPHVPRLVMQRKQGPQGAAEARFCAISRVDVLVVPEVLGKVVPLVQVGDFAGCGSCFAFPAPGRCLQGRRHFCVSNYILICHVWSV